MSQPSSARLREPLSTRTTHHVLGSVRDALSHTGRVLRVELNASVDNPLVAADGWVISNAANVDGQHLAQAFDSLVVSLIPAAVMSERRTARLLDPNHNDGLPAFLIHPDAEAGINSGLMIAQYTAAALVAELRARTGIAGIQSVPTCNNTEDHVSMSSLAARQVAWSVSTAEIIIAIELLVAAQACDIRKADLSKALHKVHRLIRSVVPVMVNDRVLADDIDAVLQLIRNGDLARAAR
ncbi:MAG: aromatic amino acid lyase [Myxococcales bacterium]|nr:MAG: aromatic amino acid lyase [Myxococcales bacterium]